MSNSPRTPGERSSDPTAPARDESRTHRRAHKKHVDELAHDRQERQEFARRHREVDSTLQVIGSLCFLAMAFGAWRLFALIKLFLDQRGVEGGVSPLVIGLEFVVEAAIVAGLVGLKRGLQRAPVRLALGLAALRTAVALLAAYALFASKAVESPSSVFVHVTVGAYGVLALFHWYAFVALKNHAAEIVRLRHPRHEEELT
jgi:hypothetical protein